MRRKVNLKGILIQIEPHKCKFFKDVNRAKEFCEQMDGSLHKKGSSTYNLELREFEHPEDYAEFEYIVIWREN